MTDRPKDLKAWARRQREQRRRKRDRPPEWVLDAILEDRPTSSREDDAPQRVWLQPASEDYRDGWTWCWEPIGDDDVAYILESLTEVER